MLIFHNFVCFHVAVCFPPPAPPFFPHCLSWVAALPPVGSGAVSVPCASETSLPMPKPPSHIGGVEGVGRTTWELIDVILTRFLCI